MMSASREVPLAVPLLVQGSRPAVPSSAEKSSRPLAAVSSNGSLVVSASGVGVDQRHRAGEGAVGAPDLPVQRRRVDGKHGEAADRAERASGLLLPAPGTMSRTSTVPATVPSLFHSSPPSVGVLAVKISCAPSTAKSEG